MKCPKCSSDNIGVANSLPGDDTRVFRYRKCHDCGHSFRTVETIDDGSFEFAIGYYKAHKVKQNRCNTKCTDPAKLKELISTLDHK